MSCWSRLARAIQKQLSAADIEQLKGKLRKKLAQPAHKPADTKPLRAKLQRYECRLLEVDQDMLPTVQSEIRKLREQIELQEHETAVAAASIDTVQQWIDQAMAAFFRLPEIFSKPSSATVVRGRLQQAIGCVVVETSAHGKGTHRCYRLLGGKVYSSLATGLWDNCAM